MENDGPALTNDNSKFYLNCYRILSPILRESVKELKKTKNKIKCIEFLLLPGIIIENLIYFISQTLN